jgi:hypothetical protein
MSFESLISNLPMHCTVKCTVESWLFPYLRQFLFFWPDSSSYFYVLPISITSVVQMDGSSEEIHNKNGILKLALLYMYEYTSVLYFLEYLSRVYIFWPDSFSCFYVSVLSTIYIDNPDHSNVKIHIESRISMFSMHCTVWYPIESWFFEYLRQFSSDRSHLFSYFYVLVISITSVNNLDHPNGEIESQGRISNLPNALHSSVHRQILVPWISSSVCIRSVWFFFILLCLDHLSNIRQ